MTAAVIMALAVVAASYALMGWVIWRLADALSKLLAAVVAQDPASARSYRDIQSAESSYRQTVEKLATMMQPTPDEVSPVGFDGGMV